MGKASSRKKIVKASRTAGRTRSSRNLGWWGLVTAIVVLGVGLVVISRPEKTEAEPPRLNDHWHAAYGINICGETLPGLVDVKEDTSGIHSHGDGLIHMHPFSSRYTGKGANLAAFGETTGMTLTDSSLQVPGRDKLKNGDRCPDKDGKSGERGVLQVMVWDSAADTTGSLLKGDFADYAPKDGSVVLISFGPKATTFDKPASAGAIPSDVTGATPPLTGAPTVETPTTSLAPGDTPTEAPPSGPAPGDPAADAPPAATNSVPSETPDSSAP